MKSATIICILLLSVLAANAQRYQGSSFRTQSYFGFSGMTFLPSTQVLPAGTKSLSYSARPSTGSEINLIPFSVRLGYGLDISRLEVTTTNTPFYASERIYSGVALSHGVGSLDLVLPIFPAVKYQLMPMRPDNYQVSMAIGFALPYGGYYVADKFFAVSFFDITAHTGVATKLTTYHVFTGLTITFGNRKGDINRDFNLEMLIEAAWAGSLKQIDKKEESFLSLSFRHAWTNALYITTFFRYDNQPLAENGNQVSAGPVTRMGLGLDFNWQ